MKWNQYSIDRMVYLDEWDGEMETLEQEERLADQDRPPDDETETEMDIFNSK